VTEESISLSWVVLAEMLRVRNRPVGIGLRCPVGLGSDPAAEAEVVQPIGGLIEIDVLEDGDAAVSGPQTTRTLHDGVVRTRAD